MTSVQHEESEMADYAALIAMIYTMVRQDYMMQVTVVYFIVLHNYFSLPVIWRLRYEINLFGLSSVDNI